MSDFQDRVKEVLLKRKAEAARAKEINDELGMKLKSESVRTSGIHDEARKALGEAQDARKTRLLSNIPFSSAPVSQQNYPDKIYTASEFDSSGGLSGKNRIDGTVDVRKGLNQTLGYYNSVDEVHGDVSPIGYKKKGGELTRIPKPERQQYLDKLQDLADRKCAGDLGLKLSSTSAQPSPNIFDYFKKDKATRAWNKIDALQKIGKKGLKAIPIVGAAATALLDSPEAAAEEAIFDVIDPFGILFPSDLGADADNPKKFEREQRLREALKRNKEE